MDDEIECKFRPTEFSREIEPLIETQYIILIINTWYVRFIQDFVDASSKDIDEIEGKFRPTEVSREMQPMMGQKARSKEAIEAI